MAQSKQQIQAILSAANTRPRHRFGQNFMIDQNLVRLIAEAGQVGPDDLVIEVGPGTGTLTEELLSRGARVLAVEIDRDLAAALRGRYAQNDRFDLIEGDALAGKHELNPALLDRVSSDPRRTKLVANLPYNIASPLVIELLLAGIGLLAFTVQKEVADRLRAPAGSDDYGPLSVMAQLLGTVELLRVLPPQAFWPAPKVDSALVRVTATRRGERQVGRFVHAVFSYRRKTLRKALELAGYDAEAILSVTGFDGARRPEQFTPVEYAAMFLATAPPRAAPGEGRRR